MRNSYIVRRASVLRSALMILPALLFLLLVISMPILLVLYSLMLRAWNDELIRDRTVNRLFAFGAVFSMATAMFYGPLLWMVLMRNLSLVELYGASVCIDELGLSICSPRKKHCITWKDFRRCRHRRRGGALTIEYERSNGKRGYLSLSRRLVGTEPFDDLVQRIKAHVTVEE